MSLLRRLLAVAVATHVVYLSVDSITLFSLHPMCMSIGFLILMSEAIVSLVNKEALSALRGFNKVSVHWALQVAALTMICVGFGSIYLVKNSYGKEHFTSWHGLLGVVAVGSCVGASSGGTAAVYATKLGLPPGQIKLVHGFFGTVAYAMGLVALGLGLRSDWFVSGAGQTAALAHLVALALFAVWTLRIPAGAVAARLAPKKK